MIFDNWPDRLFLITSTSQEKVWYHAVFKGLLTQDNKLFWSWLFVLIFSFVSLLSQ